LSLFAPRSGSAGLADTAASAASRSSDDPRWTRRAKLFRETFAEKCRRVALGTAWSLKPKRIAQLLPLARLFVMQLLEPDASLPDVRTMPDAGELVGIADDLEVETLLNAYAAGLFPRSHFGPQKWLSPRERCVLFFPDFHMSKRLKRLMRQGRYTVTFDRDFEGVIKACAGKRAGHWTLTWITPRIMHAYATLYDAEYAHSFEVWNEEGSLVGGGYGVAIGRAFFTESQFSLEPNTSKLGFSILNWHLARWGYRLNDGKWATPTIVDMGFHMVPREDFRELVAASVGQGGRPRRWTVEASPEIVAGGDWDIRN
jgi:leucyl/phenylalanyl-tRNA--protein transferase